MKRFTDTEKWIKDKWFCDLEAKHKLFWLFLIDQCDNVGVWEVNLRLANVLIGYDYTIDSLLKILDGKIKTFDNGEKWWITSFISFQHGELDIESPSKPIQSYIVLLKRHDLLKEYIKATGVKQKPKPKKKAEEVYYSAEFSEWWAHYGVGSKRNAFDAWKKQKIKKSDVQDLIAGTELYKLYCKDVERPLKDGQGWLNGRFWETTWTHDAQGTKSATEEAETYA